MKRLVSIALWSVIAGAFHLVVGLVMFGYFITDKFYNENVRELVTHELTNDDEQETA